MELELNVEGRKAILKEISREGNQITIAVDDEIFTVDLVKVGPAEFSVLYKGRSYNIEVVPGKAPKHYTVNTFYFTHEIEVVDAETRYMRSRDQASGAHASNIIRSPMPGKVVKLLVTEGDTVDSNQVLVVIEDVE